MLKCALNWFFAKFLCCCHLLIIIFESLHLRMVCVGLSLCLSSGLLLFWRYIYITKHFRWRRFKGSGLSTARTASSNTFFFIRKQQLNYSSLYCEHSKHNFRLLLTQTCLSPRCVKAEHSIYLTARILLANFWPCSRFKGANPCSAKALSVSRSSRKSIFVPAIKI